MSGRPALGPSCLATHRIVAGRDQASFELSKISQLFGIIRQIMVFRLIVRRSRPGLCGHIVGVRLVAGNACRVHDLLLCSATGTHEHAKTAREVLLLFGDREQNWPSRPSGSGVKARTDNSPLAPEAAVLCISSPNNRRSPVTTVRGCKITLIDLRPPIGWSWHCRRAGRN